MAARRTAPLLVLALAGLALADDGAVARARRALERGGARDASASVESARAAHPEDAELFAIRGEARLRLGGTIEARVDLERAAAKRGVKVAGARAARGARGERRCRAEARGDSAGKAGSG